MARLSILPYLSVAIAPYAPQGELMRIQTITDLQFIDCLMPAGWYEGRQSGEYENFWGSAGEYRGPKYGMLHDKMPPVRFLDAVHGSILVFYNGKFRCI